MSTTDVELARMIARLRCYWAGGHYKHNNTYPYNYQWVKGHRVWTDEQIMKAFGIDKERFDALVEYHRTQVPPRNISHNEYKQRYFKFWKENERWHTRGDCKNWRETGLMSNNWGTGDFEEEFCLKNRRWILNRPEMIFGIRNLTTRRNVIADLGGHDKIVQQLIKKGKAEQLQQDDFGILWKLNFPDGRDNHMCYVEVINSTQREDGEYDHYFLRVPPDTKTARAGVAWTFDKPAAKFKFAAQS